MQKANDTRTEKNLCVRVHAFRNDQNSNDRIQGHQSETAIFHITRLLIKKKKSRWAHMDYLNVAAKNRSTFKSLVFPIRKIQVPASLGPHTAVDIIYKLSVTL